MRCPIKFLPVSFVPESFEIRDAHGNIVVPCISWRGDAGHVAYQLKLGMFLEFLINAHGPDINMDGDTDYQKKAKEMLKQPPPQTMRGLTEKKDSSTVK